MEENTFIINTEFVKYRHVRDWYITKWHILKEFIVLNSPMFTFAQATFSWRYNINLTYTTESVEFQLEIFDKLSTEGIMTISLSLYTNPTLTTKIISDQVLKPSENQYKWFYALPIHKFYGDSVYIRINVRYSIPKSTIASHMTNTIESWDSNMKKHVAKLYLDPELSDITFYVEDSVFPAHRNILSVYSPIFNKMFTTQMKEQRDKEIYIHNFTAAAFNCMLYYIYTGILSDSQNLINEVIFIAHMYDIKEMINECKQFLLDNINNENVLDILLIANQLDMNCLEQACLEHVFNNQNSISKRREFDNIKEHHADVCVKLLDFIIDHLAQE